MAGRHCRELVLASQSPRRRELLEQLRIPFRVVPPDDSAECGICSGENPAQFAARMAFQKARNVAEKVGRGLILACDTVVECRGQLVGKPRDVDHAREILRLLRGNEHRVFTGVCLWDYPDRSPDIRVACTRLVMDFIPDDAIQEYLDTGLWEGKAGAFGYQDRLGWLKILEGSESNVVGLPIELLQEMLASLERKEV
ncbi:nucleoside triphosphate pyrophosphatase [Thermogutta sp.]|uniref:Maf family protein n=1 Tax=Thermogutta sp. TaxID=1962930 RepID=UPI003220405F